jgi:hypothetical protein
MRLCVLLLISSFWIHPAAGIGDFNCSSFKLKVETKDSDGREKGEIKLQVSGGKSPFKFVVYKSSGHLLSADFEKADFSDLKADTYQAIVVDQNGCQAKLEIQLK